MTFFLCWAWYRRKVWIIETQRRRLRRYWNIHLTHNLNEHSEECSSLFSQALFGEWLLTIHRYKQQGNHTRRINWTCEKHGQGMAKAFIEEPRGWMIIMKTLGLWLQFSDSLSNSSSGSSALLTFYFFIRPRITTKIPLILFCRFYSSHVHLYSHLDMVHCRQCNYFMWPRHHQ